MLNYNFVTRRVNAKPIFFKDGRLSSALFKDSNGVSVNIDAGRSNEDIIEDEVRLHELYNKDEEDAEKRTLKSIATVTKNIIEDKSVYICASPEENNRYHCLLFGDSNKKELKPSQAKALAREAKFIAKFD